MEEQKEPEKKQSHVRPRVRNRSKVTQEAQKLKQSYGASVAASKGTAGKTAEQRLNGWMGVNEDNGAPPSMIMVSAPPPPGMSAASSESHNPSSILTQQKDAGSNNSNGTNPTSILRTPKYSMATNSPELSAPTLAGGEYPHISSELAQANEMAEKSVAVSNSGSSNNSRSATPICKEFIVERDPKVRPRRRKVSSRNSNPSQQQHQNMAGMVEGYTPKSQTVAFSTNDGSTLMSGSAGNNAMTASAQQQLSQSKTSGKDGSDSKEEEKKRDDSASGKKEDNNDDDAKEENPLILGSVEDLFLAAGQQMPENVITDDTKMVEANISFSCMSAEQYKDYQVLARQEEQETRAKQYKIFQGRKSIFGDDENDVNDDEEGVGAGEGADTNDISELDGEERPEGRHDDGVDDDDDDDDDGSLTDMLADCNMSDDGDDNNDEQEVQAPRSFLKLWNVISDWITPQAVKWIERLEAEVRKKSDDGQLASLDSSNWAPQVDRSDVGTSRCAGLMVMVKMNIPNCLDELASGSAEDKIHLKRKAERRLADLLRAFDYSTPVAKLSIAEWKAMTVILLDMVVLELRLSQELNHVPKSAAAVGLSKDEYVYLTRKAFTSLGKGAAT